MTLSSTNTPTREEEPQAIRTDGVGKSSAYHLNLTHSLADDPDFMEQAKQAMVQAQIQRHAEKAERDRKARQRRRALAYDFSSGPMFAGDDRR